MPATIKIVIEGINDADAAFKDAARGIDDLGKKAQNSGGGFNALKEVAIGALRAIGEAAVSAAAAGAQAMAGFVKDSIGAAGNFESAVNGLTAVAGGALDAAGISMDDVRDKALQLGKDTAFSAQQSIEAMTALAKGGVPVVDIMGAATDATLALAAASGTDLAKAADIVAKQLGVWAKTGVTAAQVTDLLASAANASTVDVEELGLGLANAGGTAQVAGVSFQDLVQTMGLIAPNFSSAADAGTSLKTFISRLVPTTDSAAQAMVALGLSTDGASSVFFDAQGNFVGMSQAAQLLHDALAPLPKDQQLVALNTIFGSDAIRAAAAIADAGAVGYDAFGQAMADTGGAAAAAATMQQGYNFQMEQFSGSVETLQISVGTILLPLLTSLMGTLTDGVNVVLEFVNRFKNIPEAIMSSDEPIRTFLASIALMLPQISGIAYEFIKWYDAFMQFGPMSEQFLGLVWGLLNNITSAISVQVNLWITTFGQWLLDAMPGMGANFALMLQQLYTWIGEALPGIVANLAIWIQRFTDWIIEAIPVFLTQAAIFVASMLAWIAANAPAILAQLAVWTAQFVTWLVTTAARVIVGLGELLGQMLVWILAHGPDILAQLGVWAKAFADWIPGAWAQLSAALGGLWGKLTGWISETAGKLSADGSIGRALIDGIKSGINSAVQGLIDAARSAVNSALSAARSALGGGGGESAGSARAGGGFASGGPVTAGQIVPVGEHGRELFVPSQNGSIVNNSQATNNYFNYSPTYSATPSSPIADFAMMRSLAGV